MLTLLYERRIGAEKLASSLDWAWHVVRHWQTPEDWPGFFGKTNFLREKHAVSKVTSKREGKHDTGRIIHNEKSWCQYLRSFTECLSEDFTRLCPDLTLGRDGWHENGWINRRSPRKDVQGVSTCSAAVAVSRAAKVYDVVLRASRRLFLETWCRSSGMDVARTRHGERGFSYFPLALGFLVQLVAVAKVEKQSCAFFQDFYQWKGTCGCRHPNWLDQKISKWKFFGHLTKTVALNCLLFSAVHFWPRETALGPETTFFLGWDELGSPGLRGISPRLNITSTNPERFTLQFVLGIRKTWFRNCRSSRSRSTTQKSFFRGKNPGSPAHDFFQFSQRPKIGLVLIVTIGTMKDDVLVAPYASGILRRRAAPRLFVSAQLPLSNLFSVLSKHACICPLSTDIYVMYV